MDRRVLLFSIACVVITWFSIYDSNHAVNATLSEIIKICY